MIGAIRFTISDNYIAELYQANTYEYIDWDNNEKKGQPCDLGDAYIVFPVKAGYEDKIKYKQGLQIVKSFADEPVLHILETIRYVMRVKDNSLPRIPNANVDKYVKVETDKDSLTLQFINYLGRSRFNFGKNPEVIVWPFEVVPIKMDYEDDYIRLTEALAEKCAQLLLNHSGATSSVYKQSQENAKTLLEQFIFLRQFCYAQNLQALFGSIKRNPDRLLVQEDEMRPVGCGRPSRKFYTNPLGNGRNWHKITTQSGRTIVLPTQIATTHKKDSLDTVANRFLKAALLRFSDICERLVQQLNNDTKKQAECVKEAKAIHVMLQDILQDSFFDDIGRLTMMPQNNLVLQKREGYAQIFAAYSMIDLALQLHWQGKDEVYEGESKDVALLYEYWLFFELINIIKSIDSCEMLTSDESAIFTSNDGELTISLQENKKSMQAFVIPKLKMRINLYYNRTFSAKEFVNTEYKDSYSRPFRPDFTLAIFPMSFDKKPVELENMAILEGTVSYVHFDAKYRITDLTSIIGKKREEETEDTIEQELQQEKFDSVTNTYKRGDLLKMHTYNDAIRRTVGSYVLYPGSNESIEIDESTYKLYDEILPGVGAFAIKPSIQAHSENAVRDFIVQLIAQKQEISSRLNRMEYFAEMVRREPNINQPTSIVEKDKQQELTVLGYLRADRQEDYYNQLQKGNRLQEGQTFLFYYYAIKGQYVYSHHKDITKATKFRFYSNDPRTDSEYILQPQECDILSHELMSKDDLVQRLQEDGITTDREHHQADFYYVMKVKVRSGDSNNGVQSISRTQVESQLGNESFSPHSPKVINQI